MALIQTDVDAVRSVGIVWEGIDGQHTKTDGFGQVRCFTNKTIYLHGVATNDILLDQINQYARLTYNGVDLISNVIIHDNRITITITPTVVGVATLQDGCIPGLALSFNPIQFIFSSFEAPSISDYCYVKDGEFVSYAPSLSAVAQDGTFVPDVSELTPEQRVEYGIYEYRFIDNKPTGLFKAGSVLINVDDERGIYTCTQSYVALTRAEVLDNMRAALRTKRQAILYRGIYYYDEALLEMYPDNPGYYVNADSGTQATLSNMFSLYAAGMIPAGKETSYKVENARGLYLSVKTLNDVKALATVTSSFVSAAFGVEEALSVSFDSMTTEEVAAFDINAGFAEFEAATALTTTKPETQTVVLPPLKVEQIIPPVDQPTDTDEEAELEPETPNNPSVPDETPAQSDDPVAEEDQPTDAEGDSEEPVDGTEETPTDPEVKK